MSTRIEALLERAEARSRERLRENLRELSRLATDAVGSPARRHRYLLLGGALLTGLFAARLLGPALRAPARRLVAAQGLAALARHAWNGRRPR
jgi:hypothetical protein